MPDLPTSHNYLVSCGGQQYAVRATGWEVDERGLRLLSAQRVVALFSHWDCVVELDEQKVTLH